jgi:D-tyrosyl-tRNA(Tyr) deacylase
LRIVASRVSSARVSVGKEVVGEIGMGLSILLGVAPGDCERDAERLADKIVNLRIFAAPDDEEGKMDVSLLDSGGAVLLISQFTLYADCRKGRRPSFTGAAHPDAARRLYERFAECIREKGANVQTGAFGAVMKIDTTNEGPVTIILDS